MTTYQVITGLVDEMIDPTLPKAGVVNTPLYGLNGWLVGALAQEPEDDPQDLTKRGPVTRWIGYAFGNPRITKVQASALLPLQPGDPNPLFQITDAIVREGGSIQVGNSPLDLASAGPVVRAEWDQPHYAIASVITGGDTVGMEVVFEIDDPAAEVPASFPDRTYTEYADPEDPESGTEVVHTWATWGLDGNRPDLAPEQIGDKWYRSSQLGSAFGAPMPASAWVPAALAGLVVMKTKPAPE